MKIYDPTYSAAEPQKINITATKVFLADNIQETELEIEDSVIHCYQYTLTEYDKDEYFD